MDQSMDGQSSKSEVASPSPTPVAASEAPASGYGKKGGLWKWVIIYAVIAAVVYGLVYYFFLAKGNSSSGTTTETLY